jgi:hypothetical protein
MATIFEHHNGAFRAPARRAWPCNVYCGEGLHCDVIYRDPSMPLTGDSLGWPSIGLELVRIEPAMEAGPIPKEYFGSGDWDKAFLAYFQVVGQR